MRSQYISRLQPGDITVNSHTFSNVGVINISLQGGGNTVSVDFGVTTPVNVRGTAGGDTINDGGNGDCEIHGGSAANTITGGRGNATIYAGGGGDTIHAGPGSNSQIYGGAGIDTIDCSLGGNDWVQAGSGGATITGGNGHDWLYAGNGANATYTITGGAGTEKLYGGAGTNYLYAGAGLDDLYGGPGTNYLYGGGLNDLLVGGTGANAQNCIVPGLSSIDTASVAIKNSWDLTYDPRNDQPNYDGNLPPAGYLRDDYAADPTQSSPAGWWTFSYFDASHRLGESATAIPMAVYVTWNTSGVSLGGGTQWAAQAAYSVYEWINGVKTLLTTVNVNQQAAPPSDSPEGADRSWKLLGVWNAVGWMEVELSDGSYQSGDRLCVGDAMIHQIWPTVSIHAADVAVNPNVPTLHVSDYKDWLSACSPLQIPLEGDGNRVQLQVGASIEPLYYQVSPLSSNDWQAILPNVSGLEFWTAPTGGTQLVPDANGNIVVQSLSPTTGSVTVPVWASVDPNGPQANSPSPVATVAEVTGPNGGNALSHVMAQVGANSFTILLGKNWPQKDSALKATKKGIGEDTSITRQQINPKLIDSIGANYNMTFQPGLPEQALQKVVDSGSFTLHFAAAGNPPPNPTITWNETFYEMWSVADLKTKSCSDEHKTSPRKAAEYLEEAYGIQISPNRKNGKLYAYYKSTKQTYEITSWEYSCKADFTITNESANFRIAPKGISNIGNTPTYWQIYYGKHTITRTPDVPATKVMDWYIKPDPNMGKGMKATGLLMDRFVDLSNSANFGNAGTPLKCHDEFQANWDSGQGADTTLTYSTSGYSS